MKPIGLLLFLPLFLTHSCKQSNKSPDSNKLGYDTASSTYAVTSEDTSMNSAIEKARMTISEFDRALRNKLATQTNFAIKKRYKTIDGGGEHMWIAEVALVNGNYKGFINNDTEKTSEVKYGDTVIVQKDEITDWMYLDNNVLRGGYTIRDIRNKMTKAERIKMDKDLGFKIED